MTAKQLDFECLQCGYVFDVKIVEKRLPDIFCPRCYEIVEEGEEITEREEAEMIIKEVNEERKRAYR